MRVSAWQGLPIAVRAVLTGLLILVAGNVVWSFLVSANLQFFPSFPWAVPVMSVYLWVFWQYLRGSGWPRRTSKTRRTNLRISILPVRVWLWSLLAGGATFASLMTLLLLYKRVVNIPENQFAGLSQYPVFFVVALILMSAAVAGVVEESAFRGYMQLPIEHRHGLAVATAVVAIMFSLAHLSHGMAYAMLLVPLYLLGSAIYSILAYLTGSIMPGIILHTSTDVILGILTLREATSSTKPLIPGKETGFALGTFAVVFAALGIWCFRRLAKIAPRKTESSALSVVAGTE